jgi:hypothetical protein
VIVVVLPNGWKTQESVVLVWSMQIGMKQKKIKLTQRDICVPLLLKSVTIKNK